MQTKLNGNSEEKKLPEEISELLNSAAEVLIVSISGCAPRKQE